MEIILILFLLFIGWKMIGWLFELIWWLFVTGIKVGILMILIGPLVLMSVAS